MSQWRDQQDVDEFFASISSSECTRLLVYFSAKYALNPGSGINRKPGGNGGQLPPVEHAEPLKAVAGKL